MKRRDAMYGKTKQRLAKLVAWREQGLPYREIGRRLGITPSGAHNLCQRHGIARTPVRRFPRYSRFPGVVQLAKDAHQRRHMEATRAFWLQHGVAEAARPTPKNHSRSVA